VNEVLLAAEPSLSGVRGHAVLLADPLRFAIWQVTPTGQPGGAYVEARDVLQRDGHRCRAILSTFERRALVSIDAKTSAMTATSLAELAGLDIGTSWFDKTTLDLDTIWADIVAARRRYEGSIGQTLDWRTELRDTAPANLRDFAEVAHVRQRHDDPLIGETLITSDIVRWLVAQWADTEAVRVRRKPLRDAFGPPAPLPPAWLERLRLAYAKVLPL